jgi:hypothetical protein
MSKSQMMKNIDQRWYWKDAVVRNYFREILTRQGRVETIELVINIVQFFGCSLGRINEVSRSVSADVI